MKSNVSPEHASQLAIEAARKEAMAELRCYYTAEQCVTAECGSSVIADAEVCRTGYSSTSWEEAQQQALARAQAAAAQYCATGVEPDPPAAPPGI